MGSAVAAAAAAGTTSGLAKIARAMAANEARSAEQVKRQQPSSGPDAGSAEAEQAGEPQ